VVAKEAEMVLVAGETVAAVAVHQKQHHVPYSLAISINGTFLLIHGIASTLWAFHYVFLTIYF
jgi:alcohol dehydrogenase class IV